MLNQDYKFTNKEDLFAFLVALEQPRKVFRTQDRLSVAMRVALKHDKRIYFEELDATAMQSFDDLSMTFRTRFKFGEHYGENWNAYIDCMRDVPFEKLACGLIFINNTEKLMRREPKDLEIAVSCFGHVSEDWGTPINQNEWFDRPAIPVVFVLQEPDKKDRFGLPLIGFS